MAVPRQVHLFDRPTRFVAGTVGQPGDRTFYLQASDESGRTVSVALEKTQVQVLADRMNELLDEIAGRASTVIPPAADVDDLEPLSAPVDEEFRVAAMGLGWGGSGGGRPRGCSWRPCPPARSRSTRRPSSPTATRVPMRSA